MKAETRRSLEEYLKLGHPFTVQVDPEGGYAVEFPDLPGCFAHVYDPAEIGPMAEDARRAWIETAYELGREIPTPSPLREDLYSGQFRVRVPKKLHRELVETAERNDVSLNTWVVYLLSGRMAAEEKRMRSAKKPKTEDAA